MMSIFLYLMVFLFGISFTKAEPVCSQYHFVEQILEKLVRMEFDVSKMMTDSKTLAVEMKQELQHIKQERDNLRGELDTFKSQQKNLMVEYGIKQTTALENVARVSRDINKTAMDFRTEFLRDINDMKGVETLSFLARQPTAYTFSQNQVIVYGTVQDNTGDGYNASTGKFTAPVNGLYAFAIHICTYTSKYFYYGIVKNDVDLVRGCDHGSGSHSCSSASVFTSLEKGDQVWVKCLHAGRSYKLVIDNDFRNIFTGVLIHR